jgi:uncharacterized protein YgbK (DUF1537 family)
VFKGHLFVGDVLLSESGMRFHPLTPMTDANLVRVLQAQCQGKVGLIDYKTVAAGPATISQRIVQLRAEGVAIAIVDALDNQDLMRLGPALKGLPLVTAGSGVAIGLAANFGIQPSEGAADLPPPQGLQAIVSGSCSTATQGQVAAFIDGGGKVLAIDPLRLAAGDSVVSQALLWARPLLAQGPVLVYATADPQAVKAVQAQLGAERAGALVEQALGAIAAGLVEIGVRQLVVAGGETSGACVQALGISQMRIGPQIDPGVPWCHARTASGEPIHLALKSGNFGGADFFGKALRMLG